MAGARTTFTQAAFTFFLFELVYVQMVDVFLVVFLLATTVYLLVLPLNAWIYVRAGYPRRRKGFVREPDFPVNLVVSAKGPTSIWKRTSARWRSRSIRTSRSDS